MWPNFEFFVCKQHDCEKKSDTESLNSKRHSKSVSILKGSTSSSSLSSNSMKENDKQYNKRCNDEYIHSLNTFETYFRITWPWQSVYIPENVDKSIEEVINLYLVLVLFQLGYL